MNRKVHSHSDVMKSKDVEHWSRKMDGQLDAGDVELIRSHLRMSPTERLRSLEGMSTLLAAAKPVKKRNSPEPSKKTRRNEK